MLDKFTYAGNPANLPEADRLPPRRHRRRARTSTRSARSMRSSTSPPRRTSTVRSSARRTSCAPTCSGRSCCSRRREELSARFVQVSTDEVYGDVEPGWSSREDDPLAPVEPVQRIEGRRRPAGARGGADVRRQRVDHARLEHVRAEPVSGEGAAAVRRRTRSTGSRCRSTATAARCATGCTSTTTARRSSSSCARARPARSTTSAPARSTRTSSSTRLIIDHLGADSSLVRHVEDRAGHDRRYSLDTTKLRAHSAGSRGVSGRRASARRSTGTATTATGGSRSSARTVSASTTTSSTPLGWASRSVFCACAQAVDLVALALDRLRAVE